MFLAYFFIIKGLLKCYNGTVVNDLYKIKEAKTIISKNITKVKRKIASLINKSDNYLSKPENKFVQEMVIGMLLSGSCNLSKISRKLKKKISIKDTLKRLVRMSEHGSNILEIANKISLSESKIKINDDTVLALDGGDASVCRVARI